MHFGRKDEKLSSECFCCDLFSRPYLALSEMKGQYRVRSAEESCR